MLLAREMANAALAASSTTEVAKRRGCITTDKVYRPLMDDKSGKAFSQAAEDLPQWVTRLTAEEYLQAVPGADSSCLGGEFGAISSGEYPQSRLFIVLP